MARQLKPNAARHEALRATWVDGQKWETRIIDPPLPPGLVNDGWVAVGKNGYAQPLWDEYQDYRRAEVK